MLYIYSIFKKLMVNQSNIFMIIAGEFSHTSALLPTTLRVVYLIVIRTFTDTPYGSTSEFYFIINRLRSQSQRV